MLNASPWRASDDTVFGTSELEGEDKELGMQLVVETSIFNPNAELPPTTKGGKNVPLSTCHERDLQPLANIALNIHKKLAQADFIDLMVERMKNDEALGEKQVSPFYYTFEDRNLAKESQVVTSWTIKTDVGVGTSRIDFNAFTTFHPLDLVLLILFCAVTAYTCWNFRLCEGRMRRVEKNPPTTTRGRRRRSKHSRKDRKRNYSGDDDDDDTVNAIANDNDELSQANTELTSISEETDSESYASLGSLSTYLMKTSSRDTKPDW